MVQGKSEGAQVSKKPKPATVGEKLVLWFWGDMMNLADVRNPHTPCEENARAFALRIDAALRRERLKERERLKAVVAAHARKLRATLHGCRDVAAVEQWRQCIDSFERIDLAEEL